jgi:hypothetical protein
METRIIDLIKNPETLRVEDLSLLETEIEKFPYMQSLRAIYLLGVHRFYNENFSKELAKTAAYTTDKRILYNLINKTNENVAAALAASAFPFKTDLATKTPKIQEVKTEAIPIPIPAPAEVKIEEKTDLVTETQSVEISEPVSFVEENKNKEQQAVNIETPSIPDVSPIEEPQADILSPEKTETEKTELTAAEYIAAEMAKLKSGAATEEPAIAEKEENIETTETIEIISEAEKEEILVEEVKAEEISPIEIVEEKEVEVEVEIETEPVEEERFSAEELASSDTFNLRKPKETTIDFYNRKQTGFVEEIPAQKENKYSSEKPISEKPAEKEEEKETNISFYAQKQAESVEESPAQKEDFYSAKTTSEKTTENEERETTIDFYARKQTSFVEETPAQKEDFYSAKTTSESPAEKEERETTIDFYARKQTSFVEETPAQKEDFYSAKTTSESPAEKEERETTIDFYARKQTSFVEETPAQKEDFYSAETTSESSTENEERETTIDFYASKKANSDAQEEQASYSPVNIYQKQIDTEKEDTAEVSKNLVQEENISTTEEAANSEKPEPKAEIETEKVSEVVKPTSNSNVTSFISTWKSWLKIDRSEIVTPSEQDKKAAIIDKFIENNPKISPIKEDVDFIVKEKSNDISHLMTETLAQLYVEQKLYTKAIQAYKILQEKHPEKTEEFEERIEEIKKSRNIK